VRRGQNGRPQYWQQQGFRPPQRVNSRVTAECLRRVVIDAMGGVSRSWFRNESLDISAAPNIIPGECTVTPHAVSPLTRLVVADADT
jgi:hypothetical protein